MQILARFLTSKLGTSLGHGLGWCLTALVLGCGSGDGDANRSSSTSGGAGGSTSSGGSSAGGTSSTDSGGAAGAVNGSGGPANTSGGAGGAPEMPAGCVNSAAILEQHAIVERSPLVSVDRPVFASAGVVNPGALVDGETRPNPTADFGSLEGTSEWVAIDIGDTDIERLLFLFQDAGQSQYDNINGGAPVAYSIETSPDSSDGSDGQWTVVVEVTDNTVRTRAHSFDFTGQRWVRFTAHTPPTGRSVRISEILLHDISTASGDRPQDSWLFFGDSISQSALRRALGEFSFDKVVSAAHPGFQPIMLNASIGGEHLSDAILRLNSVLELNPDIQYIGIAYGTNDSWGNQNPVSIGFRQELVEVVETILDAGRTPLIAQIPYATIAHTTLPAFNAIIAEVQAEYSLPCGPDLYGWFEANPDRLGPDGVHPTPNGDVAINALWAEAAGPLYPPE